MSHGRRKGGGEEAREVKEGMERYTDDSRKRASRGKGGKEGGRKGGREGGVLVVTQTCLRSRHRAHPVPPSLLPLPLSLLLLLVLLSVPACLPPLPHPHSAPGKGMGCVATADEGKEGGEGGTVFKC